MEPKNILEFKEKWNQEQNAVSLKFIPSSEFKWLAGQSVVINLPHPNMDDRRDRRIFTISSAPSEGFVTITTRDFKDTASTFKKALFNLKTGDTIEVVGPVTSKGDFLAQDSSIDYIFLIGGIGITPVRSIMKEYEITKKQLKGTLIYANKDEDYIFGKELNEMASNFTNFKILPYFSKRIDREALKDLQSEYPNGVFEISGATVFVDEMIRLLKDIGVMDENIKTASFHGGYTEI